MLDEVGYERLTTAMIAERAGASIGTVYRYFPDRLAVLQALGERNLGAFQEEFARRLAAQPPEHWSAVLDLLLGLLEQRFAEVPGFRSIRFGDVIDLGAEGAEPEGGDRLAEQLAAALAGTGLASGEELSFRARMAVQLAESGLALAYREERRHEEAVTTTGATITGYFTHFYA